MSAPTEPLPTEPRNADGVLRLALAGIATILGVAGLGLALWLDQGEALFVRLAASAWASCF
ncbi:hypothetical protein [Aurantimonas sp. 22II-16-19i]|uniref:hypothetical protein n=1 Tax=Aurantimonas sp. 22II-16-19i TaxID=1317114 RepID=UPI0009F7D8EF|nr:hypothetical protein [Aurantimonas sp. 22II-16-19i]ORE98330.1 hypothetical protein ATO4_05082 [Aurantimonas sp. 22II-16-19i]